MSSTMQQAFLKKQLEEGLSLSAESDLLELLPEPGPAPERYVALFTCRGLVRHPQGEVSIAEGFAVGLWFPPDYLRRAEPWEVLTWLSPVDVFHPNISDRAPFICIGRLAPGTALVDILYQVFEIITYNKLTMREDDALNADACCWARQNQNRFPIDDRPLIRSSVPLTVSLEE